MRKIYLVVLMSLLPLNATSAFAADGSAQFSAEDLMAVKKCHDNPGSCKSAIDAAKSYRADEDGTSDNGSGFSSTDMRESKRCQDNPGSCESAIDATKIYNHADGDEEE